MTAKIVLRGFILFCCVIFGIFLLAISAAFHLETSVQDFCVDKGYTSSYASGVERYCYTELANKSFIFYEYKQVEYDSWRKTLEEEEEK